MTVKKKGAGGGGGSKPRGFVGHLAYKSACIREVLKRKSRISLLAKKREMLKILMKRDAWAWAVKLRNLDREILKEKKDLEEMVAKAEGSKMEIPKVKIRVELIATRKMRKKGGMNMIMPEEDVRPEILNSLGVPGQLAEAVGRVQRSVDEAKTYQEKMLVQVNNLLKLAGEI